MVLFGRLLVLDYSRQPPWGPLHGVAVACYFLQHPRHPLAPGDPTASWALLYAYLSGGQPAVDAVVAQARRRNSHRHRGRDDRPERQVVDLPRAAIQAPRIFVTTIVDVAVGGSFPAPGYPDLVRSWAESTVAAWAPAS
ncbi:DUF5946 family protein [Micromonospora sp. NPDC049523]|uniref:DUF5946 family protein n=1 Tax=Micromonospora sp. NPDC049523 TaxID=3155921 RepID=UPI003421D684